MVKKYSSTQKVRNILPNYINIRTALFRENIYVYKEMFERL